MREIKQNFDTTKERIIRLKGKPLKMTINRGRNRFFHCEGFIRDVYPNIFTVSVTSENMPLQSFSYSDVMTKNIKFYKSE